VKDLTQESLMANLIRIEAVLDDILELKIDQQTMLDVRCGKIVHFDCEDVEKSYLTYENKLVAIGSIIGGNFKSARVFNM